MSVRSVAAVVFLSFCVQPLAHAQTTPFKTDDFLWLEPPHDQKAVEWAKQRTQDAVAQLRASPSYHRVSDGLDRILKGTPLEPAVMLMGKRAVRLLITEANPYGQLQVSPRDAAGAPGVWQTVLDIAALRKQSGTPYELPAYYLPTACLPPAYSRCLLRLSPGGSDQVEIREFDLDKRDFVPNGFHIPKSPTMIDWLNQDLVIVSQTAVGKLPRTIAGHSTAVQLWHRGQPLEEAKIVFQGKPTDAFIFSSSAGSGASRYAVVNRLISYSTVEASLIRQDGRVEQVPLPSGGVKVVGGGAPVTAGPKFVFTQLTRAFEFGGKHYPEKTILSYAVDPTAPSVERMKAVYTPAADEFIEGALLTTRDQIAFIVQRRLVPKVVMATMAGDGWSVGELAQVDAGEAVTALAGSDQDNDVLVTISGFVTPSRQMLYRTGAQPRLLAQDSRLFDGSKYTTEISSAKSKDGTQIDYYLLKPRESPWKSSQPLLVTGYAAHATSFTPSYFSNKFGGTPFKLWLDRGGSLVMPAARGGGERGEAWHQAAIRERRQNSYDDFIAVTQHLIDSGYSAPSRMGVFGASAGGLLAAVLGTQRPDLFSAVVSDVPLTDLVRLKYMGKGALWLNEFGDAADPKMLKVIESYSPLQNVKPGVKYPPFFISTSTEDDRTGPGHARKLAARLESIASPVYFYEESEGGHGVSDMYRHTQLMALRMTFLIDNLMK